jgi:hypothetical protein
MLVNVVCQSDTLIKISTRIRWRGAFTYEETNSLGVFSCVGRSQQANHELGMMAIQMQTDGSVHRLSGQVVIETKAITIQTQKAEYNENTGEIVTHGDTTITLKQKATSISQNQ